MTDNQNNDIWNKAAKSIGFYLKNLYRSFRILIVETLKIQGNAHPQETIESIKKDIDFRGYNVWVLIFSIFIASIGLNINSTAVVIGAMLISPLMGPILGIGMSIGTNDWLTLKHSLRHFTIMFSISILTSTLYFLVTPLVNVQSELLARTRPTLLDVLIAFFGGLAGILAANRKIKTNVIPGVAIATALMPPLCTTGYGLATGQWNFFFGAFYLFLINSIFISLATFFIVRFLRFPVKEFVDPIKEKKTRRYIFTFVILLIVPSGYIFIKVVKESIFKQKVEQFIAENIEFEGTELVKKEIIYSNRVSQINLVMFGEPVPEKVINTWQNKLSLYQIQECKLNIVQLKNTENMATEEFGKLVDVFSESHKEIQSKNQLIAQLQEALQEERKDDIPVGQLSKELSIQFDKLESFGVGKVLRINNSRDTDTMMIVAVSWQRDFPEEQAEENEKRIKELLKVRLGIPKVKIIRIALPEKDSIKIN